MNENEQILMRDACHQGEIVMSKIAKLYAEPSEQEWVRIAEDLAGGGPLEQTRPGAYRATELGRERWESTNDSLNRAQRRETMRQNPPWQPA